jgi:hypothetical protein
MGGDPFTFLSSLLLLLSGDVESNPGPPRRSVAKTGPTNEEKIDSLSSSLEHYEKKVNGIESELDDQKKEQENKIKGEEEEK